MAAALPARTAPTASAAAFACRRTLPAASLRLAVDGVGRVPLPVSARRAKALVAAGSPAPFGLGERTLTDPSVRNVTEIDAARVTIDETRWREALEPALDGVRESLGLPPGRLVARLHKLLVYGPGGFFLPHRDTERDDSMVGTLVVVLPSPHRGGALTVEHDGETRRFVSAGASPDALALIAFYGDCLHEVKRVTEGHRVVLSHELHFEPDEDEDGTAREDALLERVLPRFFEAAGTGGERAPRRRLVYLLDHGYSQGSLDWGRLKGDDGDWARALRRVGERLDLRAWLALVTIRETWSTAGGDDGYGRFGHEYGYDEEDEDEVRGRRGGGGRRAGGGLRADRGRRDGRARRADRGRAGPRVAARRARTSPRLAPDGLRRGRALPRGPAAPARRDDLRGLDGQLRRHARAALPPRRRRAVARARALAEPAGRGRARAARRAAGRGRGPAGGRARRLRRARRRVAAPRLAGARRRRARRGARARRPVGRPGRVLAAARRVRPRRAGASARADARAPRRGAGTGRRERRRRLVARRLVRSAGLSLRAPRPRRRPRGARPAAARGRAVRRGARDRRPARVERGSRAPARTAAGRDARRERRRLSGGPPVAASRGDRARGRALAGAARRGGLARSQGLDGEHRRRADRRRRAGAAGDRDRRGRARRGAGRCAARPDAGARAAPGRARAGARGARGGRAGRRRLVARAARRLRLHALPRPRPLPEERDGDRRSR